MKFYRVALPFAVCGAEVDDDGIIVRCAPILKGFQGKSILLLMSYTLSQHGEFEEIDAPENIESSTEGTGDKGPEDSGEVKGTPIQ